MEHKISTKDESANIGNVLLPAVHSQSWRKCYHCGKFLSYKQLQEQTEVMHVYIPDTEHTQEQSYWVHKHCW